MHAAVEVSCRQADATGAGLGEDLAFLGRFDAVCGAVVHDASQRVSKPLDQQAVDLNIGTDNIELDFLVKLLSKIANDACEFPKEVAYRV